MYKKRKKRTPKKGKRTSSASAVKAGKGAVESLTNPTISSHSVEEPIMSVTAMEVEAHQDNNHTEPIHSENKAVGARKRKPTQISKIVEKPSSDVDVDCDSGETVCKRDKDDEPYHSPIGGFNNNNSPPYKKQCMESGKNGMIRNILTELKSAKEATRDLKVEAKYSPDTHEYDDDDGSLHIEEEEDETEGIRIRSLDSLKKDKQNIEEDEEYEDEGTDIRSRDDNLPFRCGVCSYGSCDKSTLLRHMRTHSGERPFQCRLCYFAFTTKANCERHLRNRHGQIDRDRMRNFVVCIPSSSNESESETENGVTTPIRSPMAHSNIPSAIAQIKPEVVEVGLNLSRKSPAVVPKPKVQPVQPRAVDEEMPLDLSMDAVDLSTKCKKDVFRRCSPLLRPKPLYPAPDVSNLLITSPFHSKKEALVHPQLPIGSFGGSQLNQNLGSLGTGTHPFSLFPFPAFNPFLQPPNADKHRFGASSPPKMPSYIASPTPSFGSRESLVIEKETKGSSDRELREERDSHSQKRSSANAAITNDGGSTSNSSVSPSATSSRSKRMDNSGEYQKPKQRRYRTERPFACPHCPARFTLRSNMERHGKHQHPTVWQRSPSNRVINRQKNQQSPLVGPPTMVHPNKYSQMGMLDGKLLGLGLDKVEAGNVNVRAVIAQQLKRKLSNSSMRNAGSETEGEGDIIENGKLIMGRGSTPDLASVSQLLDGVKNSSFAQYFAEGDGGDGDGSGDDTGHDDDDDDGSTGDDEERDSGNSKASCGEKKKSAYSSAPHKIQCQFCTRRFPWSSSLRRHLLTHTGQKPYQCSQCPLLFTTKSNCDRHLARKHNGGPKTSSGDNTTEDEEEDEDGVEGEDEMEAEVEEKQPSKLQAQLEKNNVLALTPQKPNKGNGQPQLSTSNGSSPEDAAFRCHLCEAAAGERDVLLAHMEEDHKETLHLLISKGALSSSPPGEASETEVNVSPDQKDLTHRKVMCVFCVRRFWSVEDLRRHIRSHSGERPFTCPHCSRRFTLKHSMLRHLKKHITGGTPPSTKGIKGAVTSTLLGRKGFDKNGDLIGRLLGISDEHLVEQLLSKPDAQDAAKLLGLGFSHHGIKQNQKQAPIATPSH